MWALIHEEEPCDHCPYWASTVYPALRAVRVDTWDLGWHLDIFLPLGGRRKGSGEPQKERMCGL